MTRPRPPLLPPHFLLFAFLLLLPLQTSSFLLPSPITSSSSRACRLYSPCSTSTSSPFHCLHATTTLNGQRHEEEEESATSSSNPSSVYIVSRPDNTQDLRTFLIPPSVLDPLPLPQAVYTYGNFSSMSKARKLIRKGQVLINDRDGNTCEGTVYGGDTITIVPPEPPKKKKGKGGKDGGQGRGVKKVTVLYEDDDLAVIIKPAGVAVHGTGSYSLVEEYANFLTPTTKGEEEALDKPMHAHRLDAPVGGLLVIAKTKTALQGLLSAFLERKVKKTYQAIVIGRPSADSGDITTEVEEKEALTHFKVLETVPSLTFGSLSLLELSPDTGRKHQLRRHCVDLNTPILGDIRYGPQNTLRTRGLFLWSVGVSFTHPVTGKEEALEVGLPEIFGNTMNMERRKAETKLVKEEEGKGDEVEVEDKREMDQIRLSK